MTPLMLAIQSLDPELVVECLNNQSNPFLLDGFGKKALDYTMHLQEVKTETGNINFSSLVEQAEQAWRDQLSAEEIDEYLKPIPLSHLYVDFQ